MTSVAEIIESEEITVAWDVGVLRPEDYVEHWRLSLWNAGYRDFLSPTAHPKFIRSNDLNKFKNGKLAINRLIYRLEFQHH